MCEKWFFILSPIARVEKDLNNAQNREHRRLFFRMIKYESLINNQCCCEADLWRRGKLFFQDLSKHLQCKDNLYCSDQIAMVHPTRFDTNHDFQLSPRSILAASSTFFDCQGFPGFAPDKKLKFPMPEVMTILKTIILMEYHL